MERKTKLIIVGVVIVFLLLLVSLNLSSKPLGVEENSPSDAVNLQGAFDQLVSEYGHEIANMVERIYRLETRHFKSEQYLNTFGAGMLKFGNNFPYGWTSMKNLWDKSENRPIGFYPMTVSGKIYTYIKFPNLMAGLRSVATYLQKYNAGRWNTTDPDGQLAYEGKLNFMTTKYT